VSIALVDTSIFCNILDIPGRNQHRASVLAQLRVHIENRVTLLLPMATILETGNHIAHIRGGRLRRATAQRFVAQVQQALSGAAPWTVPLPLLDPDALHTYLGEFPDLAMRGLGLGDLSIIKEFERQCQLHPSRRVFVWSLDKHLKGYDRGPAAWAVRQQGDIR
jgi:hypothetical protein